MSASTTPVVSPRKGKHARSKGLSLSSASNDSLTRFNGLPSALPAKVDLLTLDADDAFVRLSVRDIQAIESNLQSSHDQLSAKLRLLVSEKYRDMLGTANTLIEMSSSSSNLVQRLEAVRQGVDKARTKGEGRGDSLLTSPGTPEDKTAETESQLDEESLRKGILEIAAATKLLAESPDDVWRAIDSASLNGATTVPAKRALIGRELNNFKAATALRAAWIYVLCEEAWKWLSNGTHEVEGDDNIDIKALFPYISKQWHALAYMKTNIVSVSHAGLAGWYSIEADSKRRWDDVSSSYMATITFLMTSAFLEGTSIKEARNLLLSQRKKAIEEQLRRGKSSSSTTLSRLIMCMAETMIFCLRAFVIVENRSTLPHLASVFQSVSKGQEEDGRESDFPPDSLQALSTLPSASVFVGHLPDSVRHLAPQLQTKDAMDCQQTTVEEVQNWSRTIREAGKETAFMKIINRFNTVSSIGEAQIQLRESFDRCSEMTSKVCGRGNEDAKTAVEEELRSMIEVLEGQLLKRLDSLCQERTAELPAAVSESISSALLFLDGKTKANGRSGKDRDELAMEENPTLFLFDAEVTSFDLQSRLRMQTPLVQRILSSVEYRAQSLGEEMEAYAAYIQTDARKRAKRRQRRISKGLASSSSTEHTNQVDKVLQSYHSAFDSARIALIDEVKEQLEELTETNAKGGKGVQLLLFIRIAYAFEHSSMLKSSNSVFPKSSDDTFVKRLAALRKEVITRWIYQIIEDAITLYQSKVKQCLDPHLDDLGRATPAFIESLMSLVDGVHVLGCGYQSEVSELGKEILMKFVESWLDLDGKLDKEDTNRYTFDSHALSILLSEYDGTSEVAARLNKAGGQLEEEKKEQIQVALQRLRLVLLPLQPHHSSSSHTPGDRKILTEPKSAPPLPMLSIIKGREKVSLL